MIKKIFLVSMFNFKTFLSTQIEQLKADIKSLDQVILKLKAEFEQSVSKKKSLI